MCILKKTCILLAVILLLGLGACALADGGVNIEDIRVDGASVNMLTPEEIADCKSLKEIAVPATVPEIDDHAFDGCAGVTVYGTKDSEAERIAKLYGFSFVDPDALQPDPRSGKEKKPVELPAVKR